LLRKRIAESTSYGGLRRDRARTYFEGDEQA
jgi:hypothetical protein